MLLGCPTTIYLSLWGAVAVGNVALPMPHSGAAVAGAALRGPSAPAPRSAEASVLQIGVILDGPIFLSLVLPVSCQQRRIGCPYLLAFVPVAIRVCMKDVDGQV